MKRLTKPAAQILRQEIKAGNVAYNLETHIMLYGSCLTFQPRPAERPTRVKPGSDEKIEVMRLRVMMGQATVHPKDNTTPIPPADKIPKYVSGLVEIDMSQIDVEW